MFSGSAGATAWGMLFTVELVAACVMDIRVRRIPNTLVLLIMGSGMVFSVATRSVASGFFASVAGIALGFGIWILFYALGALGAGDVKFFAAVGSWLGPALTWRAALAAALVGGILAVGFLLYERRLGSAVHRIVLAASSRTTRVIEAPREGGPQHARLPYGVALASGAFIAAWWPHLFG